jgi:zinc/manganese transport system substrate-binding protein
MMKVFNILILSVLIILTNAKAQLKIVTTYPYIASITQEIVKDKAKVDFLAAGNLDPHFVVPKPSLAVKLRNADLLIINGAQLEIGWLPPLLDQANNAKIRPSASGFLDLSQYVRLIEKPENVSRAMGDVHPEGNPHFHLDPYNIPILSDAITTKLCKLEPENCSYYQENNKLFKSKWNEKLKQWNSALEKLKGTKVIEYHKLYDYFINRYGLVLSGTIEPLPGIPPTGKHLENLIEIIKTQNVKLIMQDVYHPLKPAQFLNQKTGIKYIVIPHDVGAVPEAKDIFSLFDEIVKRLTNE